MIRRAVKVLLAALVFLVLGPPDPGAASGNSSAAEPKTVELLLEGFDIDRKYISMEGPQKKMPTMSALPSDSTLWVKSMAVEMLDEEHQPISPEFVWHAWLSYRSPESGGMLTVSQGTEAVTLPEGG